jgi:quercetin dioxygenase-like cupin family protein
VNHSKAAFFSVHDLDVQRVRIGKSYREFLRVAAMSAGLYVLTAGAADPQRPHHEDEMYYVLRGKARFRAGDEDREISAGSVFFVAAEVEHRFYDIAEELAVLVFFAPRRAEFDPEPYELSDRSHAAGSLARGSPDLPRGDRNRKRHV